jgi:hypothetical protein
MKQNEDWMQKIEQQFNSQTSEEIEKLLHQCKFYFGTNIMIMNIIKNIKKSNKITFNQWKALKAQLSKNNNPTKKL